MKHCTIYKQIKEVLDALSAEKPTVILGDFKEDCSKPIKK